MTTSNKIIKHLKKLKKTQTPLPIELNEVKTYWAKKLVEKLEKEKIEIQKTLYKNEKFSNSISNSNDILRNS